MITSTLNKYERKAREHMTTRRDRDTEWFTIHVWIEFALFVVAYAAVMALVVGLGYLIGYAEGDNWLYGLAAMAPYTVYRLYVTIRQAHAYVRVSAKWGRD